MTKPSRPHFQEVLSLINDTERNGLLSDFSKEGLSGLVGLKTVGVLQRLARLMSEDQNSCYLEIGVYQGLTLVSTALAVPGMLCFGIDNFRIFDPNSENLNIVLDQIQKFGTTNAQLINADFEQALENLDSHIGTQKVSLYLIDGPHDYRSQLVCLLLAKQHLAERAVIVIDDANYPDVRMATRDFLLSHPEFKMIFEAYSPAHPANLDPVDRSPWEAGWLNGVNILVYDPDGLFSDLIPEIIEDRSLYFNEWLTHRHPLAELAPEAIVLAQDICTNDKLNEEINRDKLVHAFRESTELFENRYKDRNVYSEQLTLARFNSLRK